MFVNQDHIVRRLLQELAEANENPSAFISPEDGFGTIEAKVNEMKDNIDDWNHGQAVNDAFAVAASAIQFVIDTYKFRLPAKHFHSASPERVYSPL